VGLLCILLGLGLLHLAVLSRLERPPVGAGGSAAIALGTMTFTCRRCPAPQPCKTRSPCPFFGTTPFAALGLGIVAAAIMLGFTLLIGSDQKIGL